MVTYAANETYLHNSRTMDICLHYRTLSFRNKSMYNGHIHYHRICSQQERQYAELFMRCSFLYAIIPTLLSFRHRISAQLHISIVHRPFLPCHIPWHHDQ